MTRTRFVQRAAAPAVVGAVVVMLGSSVWWQRTESTTAVAAVDPEAAPIDHAAMGHGGHDSVDPAASFDRVAVDLDARAVEAAGIQFESVTREPISEAVRAVATIVPDESRIGHVHTRVSGWIEQLHVNTTGQSVRAGETLARIFSQELLASQTEYLMARRHAAAGIVSAVVESGRSRLRVLGMTDDDIAAIERTGEPMPLVSVRAPRSGVVINRAVTVGTSVDPSTELLTIVDLSRVWVMAEVAEHDIDAIKVGTVAALEFPAAPVTLKGRVEFLSPTLSERTRTLGVRLSVANPRGDLRPGLYGTATFETAAREAVMVSREAVVDTGDVQHVFVECHGRVLPRIVTLGTNVGERVEVLTGLEPGERVVSSGVFLLDSESRLRGSGMDAHAGH
jgi:Cu(I)/Ag(I) efflux system membrane fusion protein